MVSEIQNIAGRFIHFFGQKNAMQSFVFFESIFVVWEVAFTSEGSLCLIA